MDSGDRCWTIVLEDFLLSLRSETDDDAEGDGGGEFNSDDALRRPLPFLDFMVAGSLYSGDGDADILMRRGETRGCYGYAVFAVAMLPWL